MRFNKFLAILVSLIMVATFAIGCKKPAEENKNEAPKTTEDTTEQNTDETKDDTDAAKDEKPADGIQEGGTFVISMAREPGQYNPCATADDAAYQIIQNVFNKLLKINGNNEIIPDLAESYEYKDDGKTLIFHLRENVKWHDGVDFSADDVKWTFDKIMSEKGFASNSLSDVKEVNVIDNNTVEFKLEEPNAGLLGYIAWVGTYIMPKHIYDGTDWLENPANQSPIGTGPFKFVEQVEGESVTLEKNPDFFGKGPYVDKLVYRIIPDGNTQYQAWLNNETDHSMAGAPAEELPKLEQDEKFRLVPKTWPNKSYICFNMESGKFTDPKLREAILYGIDREDIFKKVYKSQGAISNYFIPPEYKWALNEDVKSPDRDVEKAMKLIEEAGYTKDADGYYFETTIDTFPGWDDFCVVLADQLKEIGIKLTHNGMDDPTYDEKVLEKKDFELTVLGGYQGPDIASMGSRFQTGGPMNYGNYSSEEMDKELNAGNTATTLEDRAVHYKRVQEILREDLPVVFFWDRGTQYPIKNYVKGSPADEAREEVSESEFSQVWIDESLKK